MTIRSAHFRVWWFVFAAALILLASSPVSAKELPVYPGAKLVIEHEPGGEASCCDFLTRDPFDKVLSFYERALKTRPLDPKSLAAKYPEMKAQVAAMTKQMPPQMKIRFFALDEKAHNLFEVLSTPQGVKFTIPEQQLAAADSRFSAEYKEKLAGSSGTAAPKPLSTSQLAAALPSTPPAGFTQQGEVNEDSGSAQPTVSVAYSKPVRMGKDRDEGGGERTVGIEITISDTAGNQEFAREMIKAERKEEKAVKIMGKYDGMESVEKNDYGCVASRKAFLVNNRYLVEVTGPGMCDLAVLNKTIDSMHLGKLK